MGGLFFVLKSGKENQMKQLKILLVALVLFSTFAITAIAESEISENTDASITFVATDESATDPVNPDNPNETGTETGTGMNGKLTLDYVPCFSFGSQNVGTGVETFTATNLKPFIQITDKRGTGDGWKIQVKLTDFSGDKGTFKAVLSLANGESLSTTNNKSTAPSVATPVTVTSGEGEVNVAIATTETKTGMGTWIVRWYPTETENTVNDSVTLTMDTSSILIGDYTATLDWIFTDAP